MTTAVAIVGFALLFAFTGLMPLKRGGGCGADCGTCDDGHCELES